MSKQPNKQKKAWQHQHQVNINANIYGFDIEVFPDFWCVAFHYYQKVANADSTVDFIKSGDPSHPHQSSTWMFRSDNLDDGGISQLVAFLNNTERQLNHVFVAWNVSYDLKMLEKLVSLYNSDPTIVNNQQAIPQLLKQFSDHYINNQRQEEKKWDPIESGVFSQIIPIVTYDAADIYLKKRDANGNTLPATSLKEAAANNGSSIMESTIAFDQPTTDASQRAEIIKYNHNDVQVMMEIFQRVAKTPYLLKLEFVKALETRHYQNNPDQDWKGINAIVLRQSEQGLVKKMLNWTKKRKEIDQIEPFFLYDGHRALLDVIKSVNFVKPNLIAWYKKAINHVFIDKVYLKTDPKHKVPFYQSYLLTDKNLKTIQNYLVQQLANHIDPTPFDQSFSNIRKQVIYQISTHPNYQSALNDPTVIKHYQSLIKLINQYRHHVPNNSPAHKHLYLYYQAFKYIEQPYQHFEINIANYHGMDLQIKEGGIHASRDGIEIETESWSADVASYYPNEIINRQLLNPELLANYRAILEQRLVLKKQKDPIEKVYKLVINKVYGYTGDSASSFYDNKASFSVCLNGQFQLLVLVEMLNDAKIVKTWIQMNTDGIQFVPIDTSSQTIAIYEHVLKQWEQLFNFSLETTKFKYFMNFNVSTYIGITTEGKIKNKGKNYKDVEMDINAPGYTFSDLVFQQNIISHLLHQLFVNKQDFLTTFKANQELWKYQNVAKFGNTYQKIYIQHNQKQTNHSLATIGFDTTAINNEIDHPALEQTLADFTIALKETGLIKNHALRGFYSQSGYYIKKFKQTHLSPRPSDLIKNYQKAISPPALTNTLVDLIPHQAQALNTHFKAQSRNQIINDQNLYNNFTNLMHHYFGINWLKDLKIKDDQNQAEIINIGSKHLLKAVQKQLKDSKHFSTISINDHNHHKWYALKKGLSITTVTNEDAKMQKTLIKSVVNRYFVNFDQPEQPITAQPVMIEYQVHDWQSQNNHYLTINLLKPELAPKYELVWNGENIGGISDFPCHLYLDQIHHLSLNDVDFEIDYQAYGVLAIYALLGLDGFEFDKWLLKHHQALKLDLSLVQAYANGNHQALYQIVPKIFGFEVPQLVLKELAPKSFKTAKKQHASENETGSNAHKTLSASAPAPIKQANESTIKAIIKKGYLV